MKSENISKRMALRIITIIIGIFLTGQIFPTQAQSTTTAPERGVSSNKSYSISDIETIGLYSGNLMFNVPLGALPAGRGGMSAGINLRYDSKIWDMFSFDIQRFTTTHDVHTLEDSDEGGWRYGYKYRLKLDYRKLGFEEGYCTSGNENSFSPYKLKLVMPDGSQHELVLGDSSYIGTDGFMKIFPDGRRACSSGTDLTGTIVYYTTDNTFLRLELTSDYDSDWENNTWTLYAPDGTRVIHNPTSGVSQRIKDRNENYIDVIENATDSNYSNHRTTYLQDQLGRKVVIEYNGATDEDWIHSKGFDGANVKTRVKWKNITVNKLYFAGEMAPSPLDPDYYENLPVNQTFRVVEEIFLPEQLGDAEDEDDFSYTFSYNVNTTSAIDVGWGEVSRVDLPSGAYATYEYKFDNVSGWNSSTQTGIHTEEVLYNRPVEKELHYNKEYDGSSVAETETWTYSTTPTTPGGLSPLTAIVVTSPDGSTTKEYFAGADSTFTPPSIPEYVRGESYKMESADGTIIEKVYKTNIPASASLFEAYKANRYVKYEFISPKDASGNYPKTAIKEYSRDKNGNVTEVKEYDYVTYSTVPRNSIGIANGLPSGATPARITKTEYYNDTPDASSSTYTDTESYHFASSPRVRNAVESTETQDSNATPKSRNEITYDNSSTTANPTATKSWDSTKGSYSNPLTTNSISTSISYDSYGNHTSSTDANGNQTQITYGSINGYSGLYPTQTVTAYGTSVVRTSTATYDFYTGLVKTSTDEDNDVTNGTEYDELGRATKTKTAVNTVLEIWTTTEYDDTNRKVIVRADLETKGDGKKIAIQHFDQLGRVRLSRQIEDVATEDLDDEQDGIKIQTRYLISGNYTYQLVSNPYRASISSGASSEESMGWTRTKSNVTEKTSEVETFTGATLPQPFLTSGYNTNSTGAITTNIDLDRTLVTDQAGKQRISKTNALGWLTDVWEIVPSSDSSTVAVTFPNQSGLAYGYQTSYSYNILNNLTTVSQGSQTRSFSYSSLSRLLSATNPESGTISYEYDNNGNLTEKTDARSIETDYSYDALNRVTTKTYSDSTPDITYTYDDPNIANSKGRLTKVDNSFSKTEYTGFDLLGRVKKSKQTTDGTVYNEMEYIFNLSGALIEQKYPSGRVVKNILNQNGDLSIVQSKKNANYGYFNYAHHFTYTAAGAVSSIQLGNGRWESTLFNSRLQPTQIALGVTQNTTNLLDLDFSYGTTANNGNVLSQTINVPTVGSYAGFTAVQTYTYDSLNRIKDATENLTPSGGSSVNTWKQTFQYDRYGNRSFDEGSSGGNYLTTSLTRGCSTSGYNPNGICDKKKVNPVFASTNRIAQNQDGTNDYLFDDGGNTTKDASGNTFIYDAENKQIEVKNLSSVTIGQYWYDGDGKRVKKYVPATGEITIFIYDASGKMVAEYSTITTSQQDAQVSYLTNDHLGSPRIITDENGAVTSRRDFMPFGEEIASSQRTTYLGYATDNIRQKFTSYERDIETDLDFAQSRMYANRLGRFTTTDPIMLKKERMADPQRINLYSYVRNNPLIFTDPKGTDLVLGEGDQKRLRKALIEIAKRKDGRELLQKLDNLTIQIILQTGSLDGKKYERIGGKDSKNPSFTRERDDKNNITDIKGDTISVTLDTGVVDKDRKENKTREENNKAAKQLGIPTKPLIENVPSSDAQVVGHGLVHGEFQFFQNGDTNDEDEVDDRINNILEQPVDKNLSKDAETFVDNLLKPKQEVEQPKKDKKQNR